jgi:hypothetical protein
MGPILSASEKTNEGPALLGYLIANRPLQRGETGFEGIEHGGLRGLPGDFKLYLSAHPRQQSQVGRKHNPNHDSV